MLLKKDLAVSQLIVPQKKYSTTAMIPTFFVASDVRVAISVRTDEAVTFMTMSDKNTSTW